MIVTAPLIIETQARQGVPWRGVGVLRAMYSLLTVTSLWRLSGLLGGGLQQGPWGWEVGKRRAGAPNRRAMAPGDQAEAVASGKVGPPCLATLCGWEGERLPWEGLWGAAASSWGQGM